MDLNRSEAPYHSGRGFKGMMSDNEALYSYRCAHRFIPRGELVAMLFDRTRPGAPRCRRGDQERIDGRSMGEDRS